MEVNDACEFLMRQTDYTREIALEKLIQYDMKTDIIIREWMGIPTTKQPASTGRSNNQKVFDEFRTFLDDAATKYYKKQESK